MVVLEDRPLGISVWNVLLRMWKNIPTGKTSHTKTMEPRSMSPVPVTRSPDFLMVVGVVLYPWEVFTHGHVLQPHTVHAW